MTWLTPDRKFLLSLLERLVTDAAEDTLSPSTARLLESHLGLGWAREYAVMRSPEEREECVLRRLRLHAPIRARAEVRASASADVTAYEDGGAR
jgi:hypothetical protein